MAPRPFSIIFKPSTHHPGKDLLSGSPSQLGPLHMCDSAASFIDKELQVGASVLPQWYHNPCLCLIPVPLGLDARTI